MKYLQPNDVGAFVDYPKMTPNVMFGFTQECQRCKGHGGWNLALDAYPLHSYENTPENRHRYAHFRCMCDICYGNGYLREDTVVNSQCVVDGHVWSFVKNLGRCYNRYKCETCGIVNDVDSSD